MAIPDESPQAMFVRVLGAPEVVAQALCSGDITSLEELAYIPLSELQAVAGVPEWLLLELRERARSHLLNF